jgi:hypothetical protein
LGQDSLLERVITAAEERHLSQNALTAYRHTWLKLIVWLVAEALALETLPAERAGQFYEEATRSRSASHHQGGFCISPAKRFNSGITLLKGPRFRSAESLPPPNI